jgi:hypothetical protein
MKSTLVLALVGGASAATNVLSGSSSWYGSASAWSVKRFPHHGDVAEVSGTVNFNDQNQPAAYRDAPVADELVLRSGATLILNTGADLVIGGTGAGSKIECTHTTCERVVIGGTAETIVKYTLGFNELPDEHWHCGTLAEMKSHGGFTASAFASGKSCGCTCDNHKISKIIHKNSYNGAVKVHKVYDHGVTDKQCAVSNSNFHHNRCWCNLPCPAGQTRYGDGSACSGGGKATCDLGYCANSPNNYPRC